MRPAALVPLLAASALLLGGCVTVVVPDRDVDDRPVPEDLDNRSELSCSTGEELVLNNPSTFYTVSGACDSLTIEGTDLIVRAEQVDDLVLRGDRLLVEAAEVGTLEIDGQDNTVTAESVETVEVSGDRNTVSSETAIDDAVINGNDNVVG